MEITRPEATENQDEPPVNDGTAVATTSDETVQEVTRPVVVKLLKTTVQGGILTLTNRELILGEGWLGARNVRRFPLNTFARLDVVPSPGDRGLRRSFRLCFVWADGQTTEVDNVGPLATQRIQEVIRALRRPAMRQYVL